MPKHTTEQQRARELQRTERAQGRRIGYHDALNRVRAIAEVQAEHPEQTVVFVPNAGDGYFMLFEPDADPEYIRSSITPPTAAEVELSNELFQRKADLLRTHSKAQLVAMVRRRWVGGTDPASWSKEELAADIVDSEDGRERYEAYGRVALHNGKPARGSRPHCGGSGCSGHDSTTPWPETRARFRAQEPCTDAQ